MTLDLDQLSKLAEAATPGEWLAVADPNAIKTDDWCVGIDGSIDYVAVCALREMPSSSLHCATPHRNSSGWRGSAWPPRLLLHRPQRSDVDLEQCQSSKAVPVATLRLAKLSFELAFAVPVVGELIAKAVELFAEVLVELAAVLRLRLLDFGADAVAEPQPREECA